MPRVLNIRDVINLENWGGGIKIDRTTKWGNPFPINKIHDRNAVCDMYSEWLYSWIIEKDVILMGNGQYSNKWVMEHIDQLRGKDVICWCAPLRCHGELLLELANK